MKRKCILNIQFARQLISEGFKVIDVQTSRKLPGRVAFIFELTPELEKYLLKENR